MRPASATARVWLCTLLAALCAGCGGGEAPEPKPPEPNLRVIEFYGDSLTFGSIAGRAGELARLSVPPVRRAQEMLGEAALAVDYSLPGATAADALAGVAGMPFGPFAGHIATSPAHTLVLRYGGADAVRGTPLADFERDLSALVTLAQSAGKTVLLVGVIAFHPAGDVTQAPPIPWCCATVGPMPCAARRWPTSSATCPLSSPWPSPPARRCCWWA
jgi:hypothetical protein